MRRLIKSRDYLKRCLGFLLIFGFISLGAIGGCGNTGDGPDFAAPRGIAVEADGSLVVVDSGLKAVVRVDPTTGNRTIISDDSTGMGDEFAAPSGIAVEADGSLVVVDSGLKAVVRVDPTTGDRMGISMIIDPNDEDGMGMGDDIDFVAPNSGIAVEADGSLVVVDSRLTAVIGVDSIMGDRTIISDADMGDGPGFGST